MLVKRESTDADRSHGNDNMINVVHPDYIHTTHILLWNIF